MNSPGARCRLPAGAIAAARAALLMAADPRYVPCAGQLERLRRIAASEPEQPAEDPAAERAAGRLDLYTAAILGSLRSAAADDAETEDITEDIAEEE